VVITSATVSSRHAASTIRGAGTTRLTGTISSRARVIAAQNPDVTVVARCAE
jgi:hypothetical protein